MGSARRGQRQGPDNLQYVAADIFHLPFDPGSCDRVYSSALLPHIILDSVERAQDAVHAMASLLADEGELVMAGFKRLPCHHATHVTAHGYHKNPQLVAARAVGELTLGPASQFVQEKLNALEPYLGKAFTGRF